MACSWRISLLCYCTLNQTWVRWVCLNCGKMLPMYERWIQLNWITWKKYYRYWFIGSWVTSARVLLALKSITITQKVLTIHIWNLNSFCLWLTKSHKRSSKKFELVRFLLSRSQITQPINIQLSLFLQYIIQCYIWFLWKLEDMRAQHSCPTINGLSSFTIKADISVWKYLLMWQLGNLNNSVLWTSVNKRQALSGFIISKLPVLCR